MDLVHSVLLWWKLLIQTLQISIKKLSIKWRDSLIKIAFPKLILSLLSVILPFLRLFANPVKIKTMNFNSFWKKLKGIMLRSLTNVEYSKKLSPIIIYSNNFGIWEWIVWKVCSKRYIRFSQRVYRVNYFNKRNIWQTR